MKFVTSFRRSSRREAKKRLIFTSLFFSLRKIGHLRRQWNVYRWCKIRIPKCFASILRSWLCLLDVYRECVPFSYHLLFPPCSQSCSLCVCVCVCVCVCDNWQKVDVGLIIRLLLGPTDAVEMWMLWVMLLRFFPRLRFSSVLKALVVCLHDWNHAIFRVIGWIYRLTRRKDIAVTMTVMIEAAKKEKEKFRLIIYIPIP